VTSGTSSVTTAVPSYDAVFSLSKSFLCLTTVFNISPYRVGQDEVGYRDGDGLQVTASLFAELEKERKKEGGGQKGHCQVPV
jgi:hypothetical protein